MTDFWKEHFPNQIKMVFLTTSDNARYGLASRCFVRDRPFCQIYLTGTRMPGFYSHGRASTQRLRTVTSGLCNDFSPPMLSEPYSTSRAAAAEAILGE